MRMPIFSAIYVNGNERIEYNKNDITPALYNSTLKGHLYCPTERCPARIIYNSGVRSFLRTWNLDNHIEDCIHGFDRVRGRIGVNPEHFINVELSEERKVRALREAYNKYMMTEEEREQKRQNQARRRNNPTTTTRTTRPIANLVLEGGEEIGGETVGVRSPHLLKRTADMLKEVDNNKPRLIMGIIQDVEITEGRTVIKVMENGVEILVVFGEAFAANSPTYIGLFGNIIRYMNEHENVVFTGIGEVRHTERGVYELLVFHGAEFRIDDTDLIVLSSRYATGE